MERQQVEQKLATAEAQRAQAARRLAENEQRLAQLEDERVALLNGAEMARRGVSDFDEHLERLRSELAAVQIDEARADVVQSVRSRDQAVEQAAATFEASLVALRRIDQARVSVAEAHGRLRALEPTARESVPPEPDTLEEKWAEFASVFQERTGRQLETDLVDAAARSVTLRAIDELPGHLRELALQRRHDLMHGGTKRRAG